jgi:glycosyltransferase involved in cell wall biosynthesis
MIRLYGTSIGNGSFARVTEGMLSALEELGQLSGFVPVDAYDEESCYPGYDAETAVFVADPRAAGMMQTIGVHQQRLVLLPANSSYMPKNLIERLEKLVTGFLAPSTWAAEVLRLYTKLPVEIWRHGVSPAFAPVRKELEAREKEFIDGTFRVAHLSSTSRERKGTRELLKAWRLAKPYLGQAWLHMYVDCPEGFYGDDGIDSSIVWHNRLDLDVKRAAELYCSYHLIAQPSRAEGFGLVPLEARACGVPVLMTRCTGHADHIGPGVIALETGPNEPIDDGPGAIAPSLYANEIKEGLLMANRQWISIQERILKYAPDVSKEWSWKNVTEKWLKEYK